MFFLCCDKLLFKVIFLKSYFIIQEFEKGCDTHIYFENFITFIKSNDYLIGIHPAVIAGLASRESRAGKLLYSTNGWGDHHNAYGIMQVKKICN